MGRKKGKRQGDPSRDDAESTDTEGGDDEERDSHHVACPHVNKAVQLGNIKKTLKVAWVRVGQCSHCFKEHQPKSPQSLQLKRVKNEVIRRENFGKLSSSEIKKMQLERAREERLAAAEKLKALKEDKSKIVDAVETSTVIVNGDNKEDETPGVSGSASVVSGCWLCMRCGSQGCDDNNKKHSLGHYKVPRSDLHCLIVNTDNFSIWCYECNTEINVNTHKKLFEVVELVKKTRDKPADNNNKSTVVSPLGSSLVSYSSNNNKLLSTNHTVTKSSGPQSKSYSVSSSLARVRGLSNLGNTCFFNSVLQCLSQSHSLTDHIQDQVAQSALFSVRGADLCVDDDSECEAGVAMFDVYSDLSVKLAEPGPMMTCLASFFRDMTSSTSKSSVINPGSLFSQVARQCPKFRGMQQQDSHELLRYLMDLLKTEETKRQKSAVLKYFGLSEKSDPKDVPKRLKRKLQAYGRETNHCLLDKIFSGQLVSMIVCEVCHHSSVNYEQFLDLSLPITDNKPIKPFKTSNKKLSHASDDGFEPPVINNPTKKNHKKSKRQLKKEKIKMRKEKRQRRKSEVKSEDEDVEENEEKNENANEIEEKENKDFDENVEENQEEKQTEDEDENIENEKSEESLQHENEAPGEDVVEKTGDWEWDYGEDWEDKQVLVFRSKDRCDSKGEVLADEDEVDDVSVQLISVKCLNDDHCSDSGNSSCSDDQDDDDDDDDGSGSSSNGDVEDNDNDEDRANNNKWVVSKNLLNNLEKFDSVMQTSGNCDPALVEVCRRMSRMSVDDGESSESRMTREWTARTLTTLSPRPSTSSDECSLYSCLNNFTQSELLAGSNKWACDSCTKLKNENDTAADTDCSTRTETVYSPAYKQSLIFCPPAILTLHLKRFQQTLSGCKKVNKHVSFPLDLDLGSYCSSTSVAMPHVGLGQSQVLYRLYGVVEHSGGLSGGHYTAFVKVRPAQGSNNDFFSPSLFKPTDVPRLLENIELKVKASRKAASNEDDPGQKQGEGSSSKRWFHVSDSSVNEVSEEKVLKCQAYLLFYERIK